MTSSTFGCDSARSVRRVVDGIELHSLEWRAQEKPPLCLLHGGAAHAHWFDGITPALRGKFDMVSPDQRGHGASAWPPSPAYATEDFAADLRGLMDVVGWRRMALVGHSMGGHNAMAFAAWHPERVSALVIVDSRPALPAERLAMMQARGHRGPRVHATAEAAVHAFRLLPRETTADPALIAHLARVGIVEHGGGWKQRFDPQCNASRKPVDAWPLLPRITAPTLIVRGALSPILPADMAERMAKEITGSRPVVIEHAHHHLVLDRPAEFAAVLKAFLTETVGA